METEETKIKDKEVFYIFLDIDGVLNNADYIEECWEKNGHHAMHMNHVPFDPKCLNNLMLLVQHLRLNYEVKIVLSSTWRLHEVDYEIVDARIAEYGLTLSGKTPLIGPRGAEIRHYLENNTPYAGFLILDDDIYDIKPYYSKEHIHTNFKTGFDNYQLKEAMDRIKFIVKGGN